MTQVPSVSCPDCRRPFRGTGCLAAHRRATHDNPSWVASKKGDQKPKGLLVAPACPYCRAPAVFHKTSTHIYGTDYGPIWVCAPCEAWVGCHPNGAPLGRLANKALRQAKQAAHAAFDPLVTGKMRRDGVTKNHARGSAYKWLAGQLGIDRKDCHIGMFDEATCERVVAICSAISTVKSPTAPGGNPVISGVSNT